MWPEMLIVLRLQSSALMAHAGGKTLPPLAARPVGRSGKPWSSRLPRDDVVRPAMAWREHVYESRQVSVNDHKDGAMEMGLSGKTIHLPVDLPAQDYTRVGVYYSARALRTLKANYASVMHSQMLPYRGDWLLGGTSIFWGAHPVVPNDWKKDPDCRSVGSFQRAEEIKDCAGSVSIYGQTAAQATSSSG